MDWRRSFVTTDVNPYFDSFVRWQFNTLRKLNLIQFGKRHTIYSPKDGQPCMDHDRKTGEGVAPKEYTLIKLRLLHDRQQVFKDLGDRSVSLVAATLRPETMYGQTNCFVHPEFEYGLFQSKDGSELVLCTHRAARNMYHQHLLESITPVKSVKGAELIGCQVHAPLSTHKAVFVLPMKSILANKVRLRWESYFNAWILSRALVW